MYDVGQVVYALLENKKIIIPIRVIEEITIKNLESEITTYKVLIPNNKKEKVNLDKFDHVFSTVDEASSYMIENAKKAIDDLAFKAVELEEKFFSSKEESDTCINDINNVKIDLGDGTTANVNINNLENLNLQNKNSEKSIEESASA